MIYWRYYCVSEVLMDLRLVCVIMPRSRCLLSSLWKPSVAGSPFKSSRGYGSSSLRPLRNGHDRGPPPQSQTSPTQCPPDLRPCLYLPASTPPCARMICEPELSCAGMCNGTPDKHMVMIVRFLVSATTFESLSCKSLSNMHAHFIFIAHDISLHVFLYAVLLFCKTVCN